MCSRASVMFLSGDEFCNTQYGNNNVYCQDNEISWVDWTRKDKFDEMFEFSKRMIKFRKDHPVVRKITETAKCGLPDISYHHGFPWNSRCAFYSHLIGIMFAGRKKEQEEDDIVFISINSYWEPLKIKLPRLPAGLKWKLEINTAAHYDSSWKRWEDTPLNEQNQIVVKERSVVIAIAVRN